MQSSQEGKCREAQSPEKTAPAAKTPSPVAAWSEPASCLCYVPLAGLLMQLLSLATPWHPIAQADGNVLSTFCLVHASLALALSADTPWVQIVSKHIGS